MTNKIFRSTVLVAVIVLLCSLSIVMGVLHSHFTQVQVQQLKDELSLAVTGTEQYGNAFLENVEADRFRITWISTNGTVLFDTQADQSIMENHADREEIREAFASGSGRMAKSIVEPLNRLDLEQPLKNDVYEEISPLLNRIHRQHRQIIEQVGHMKQKADEFQQITAHMQEGLILLDGEATVLSMNPAAKVLFETENDCVGKNFLTIDRSSVMRNAVNDALDRGRGYARQNRNGRHYQFDLSRIESEGSVIGAVVLIFDITERLNSEQMRREFSANVSHELKTPLQGIIGSAELLESGVVKQEDEARFVGHIKKEATRLVNLIQDILRLSQLDEGIELPTEDVDKSHSKASGGTGLGLSIVKHTAQYHKATVELNSTPGEGTSISVLF